MASRTLQMAVSSALLLTLATARTGGAQSDPAACASGASALGQAESAVSQVMPLYNAASAEERATFDAQMRTAMGPGIQRVQSMPGAGAINARVRAATGRSLVEIAAGMRTLPQAAEGLRTLRRVLTSFCSAPPLPPVEAARVEAEYRFDQEAFRLEEDRKQATDALADAKRREKAFEEAVARSDVDQIANGLRTERKELQGEINRSSLEMVESAAGLVIGNLKAAGETAKQLYEVASHQKDWGTGMFSLSRFAEKAMGDEPLRREDWEKLGSGVLGLTAGTATAIGLMGAGAPAAGTAAAVGATIAIGSIASNTLERGLLNLRKASINEALRSAEGPIAENRKRLTLEIRAARQRVALLDERRRRLQQARERLGLAPE